MTLPGCYCFLGVKKVKLFDTYYDFDIIIDNLLNNGDFTFIDKILYIKCNSGFLIVNKVQIEGKNIITAADFKNMNHKVKNFL